MNFNLLLKSYPIVLKKELAVNIGLKEAIVLQQIYYWITHNKKEHRNFIHGKYWTYNTFANWKKQFPFWSERTIKTVFEKLKKAGYLETAKLNRNPSNHTVWYTIKADLEQDQDNNLAFQLLYKSQPISVSKELAHKIGLNEAIVLQQIQYWLNNNEKRNKNFFEGRYWTHNTVESWAEQFPFWSFSSVEKILSALRKNNLLITGNFNSNKFDKTQWYAINYKHEVFQSEDFNINNDIEDETRILPDSATFEGSIAEKTLSAEDEKTPNNCSLEDETRILPDSANFEGSGHQDLHYHISNKDYQIITKETRARAISIDDFLITKKDKKKILEEEQLTEEHFEIALKEYTLHCKKKYPYDLQTYDFIFYGLHLWCSRFKEVKKIKQKVKNFITKEEETLENLKNNLRLLAENAEGQRFYKEAIDTMGGRFLESKLNFTTFVSITNAFLCLKIECRATDFIDCFKTHSKEIKNVLKAFKGDLKGVKFFDNGRELITLEC